MNDPAFEIPDFTTDADRVLDKKRRVFQCSSNRASALDDPCLRRLVYARTNWQDATSTELSLQGVFETGNELEPIIERILAGIGRAATPQWRIVGSQVALNDKFLRAHNITGTPDGVLQVCDPDSIWQTVAVPDT